MDRLISQFEVIRAIEKYIDNIFTKNMGDLINDIKAIPSAEPKTGHWIKQHGLGIDINYEPPYKCSECNGKIRCTKSQLVNYPYCCHCGAKMVDEQESENKK